MAGGDVDEAGAGVAGDEGIAGEEFAGAIAERDAGTASFASSLAQERLLGDSFAPAGFFADRVAAGRGRECNSHSPTATWTYCNVEL